MDVGIEKFSIRNRESLTFRLILNMSLFLSKAVMSRFVFQKRMLVMGKGKRLEAKNGEGVLENGLWLVHFVCLPISHPGLDYSPPPQSSFLRIHDTARPTY